MYKIHSYILNRHLELKLHYLCSRVHHYCFFFEYIVNDIARILRDQLVVKQYQLFHALEFPDYLGT